MAINRERGFRLRVSRRLRALRRRLFVGLEQNDRNGRTKAAARQLACELTLESGTLVSVFVADRAFLRQH